MPSKPLTVVCYICGREFGSHSLDIHERQCIKKWHIENKKLPKHQQRPAPVKPQQLPQLQGAQARESWNEAAWASAQSQQLKCKNCGRTFNPDRLEIHQRSCTSSNPSKSSRNPVEVQDEVSTTQVQGRPGTGKIDNPKVLKPAMIDVGANPEPSSNRGAKLSGGSRAKTPARNGRPKSRLSEKNTNNNGPKRRPNLVFCYICGREFTTASLPIHEPQCLQKWRIENSKLPKNMRRPEPKKPQAVPLTGNGAYDAQAMNAAAYEAAQSNLVSCDLCGRSFASDRIQTHVRICMKTGGSKGVPKLIPCDRCGQMNAEDRFENHMRFCKGKPVAANANNHAQMAAASNMAPTAKAIAPPQPLTGMRRASERDEKAEPKAKVSRQPKFVFCYICGRQFTDASLPIHEPQCMKKWEVRLGSTCISHSVFSLNSETRLFVSRWRTTDSRVNCADLDLRSRR